MPRNRAFIFADDAIDTLTVISALRTDAKLDIPKTYRMGKA